MIRFDGDELAYRPGQTFSGQYWIESVQPGDLKAVEVSVLWHTEGKGDEDMAIHEFWRREGGTTACPWTPAEPERFSTTLPNSPLSYEGQIIKLRWCVRVRAFPHHGREIVGEKGFQLGNVPPLKVRS